MATEDKMEKYAVRISLKQCALMDVPDESSWILRHFTVQKTSQEDYFSQAPVGF